MNQVKFKVVLNGTDKNPWHPFGLSQNPFPQVARSEYAGHILTVQRLGGDPIPNTDYIREVLAGFDPAFVDGVCARFRPGERVEFEVTFPD